MVEYRFYIETYEGTIFSEYEFPDYARRAEAVLNRYKRIYNVSAPDDDAEGMAICAMAEAMHGFELVANGEGGPVESLSVGSVSVSYGNAPGGAIDISPKGQARELYRCASLYLDIYRGVR